MRITSTIQQRNFLDNLGRLKAHLDRVQNEVSTGKSVNRLSDDPFAAAQASKLSAVIGANDQFIAMNDQLRGKLDLTDSVLETFNKDIDAAQTLAAQALSGTTTPEGRSAIAASVEGVRQQILSVGNTQFDGGYLFAGTLTTTTPFVDTGGTVEYQGNNEAMYQRIDPSTVIQSNVSGQQLFVDPPPVFTVLDDLKAAILANDPTSIRADMDKLTSLSSRVNTTLATVGNNMQLLDQFQGTLRSTNQSIQEHVTNLTSADLAKAISDMSLANQAITASLNAQGTVEHLSLLDFLR